MQKMLVIFFGGCLSCPCSLSLIFGGRSAKLFHKSLLMEGQETSIMVLVSFK